MQALAAIHHAAVYQQRMAGLMEAVVCPVLQMLTNARLAKGLQVRPTVHECMTSPHDRRGAMHEHAAGV